MLLPFASSSVPRAQSALLCESIRAHSTDGIGMASLLPMLGVGGVWGMHALVMGNCGVRALFVRIFGQWVEAPPSHVAAVLVANVDSMLATSSAASGMLCDCASPALYNVASCQEGTGLRLAQVRLESFLPSLPCMLQPESWHVPLIDD